MTTPERRSETCLTCARLTLQRAAAMRKGLAEVAEVEREREQHESTVHR
ncbi:hypothetical protein Q3V23_24640 [Streptomyces sp. VNUA116]|nr:hypothetical protein [Streptomyces sp. VNUA116]WKU46992.1 hypothetical protein Q3V23_24640 [Streptomyces sp. VNUA116]